jgi:DNA-binding transcriptional ArsR family regulator
VPSATATPSDRRSDPWAALSDPTRREVLALVAERPRSVAEIASGLPVSRPAVSQHLRVLATAELVVAQPEGRRNIYRVRHEGFRRLRTELEQFWSETLVNLKQLTEQDVRSAEDPAEDTAEDTAEEAAEEAAEDTAEDTAEEAAEEAPR